MGVSYDTVRRWVNHFEPKILIQPKRNKHAALKLMRKLLKKYACVPGRLVTDDFAVIQRRGPRSGDRKPPSARAMAGA